MGRGLSNKLSLLTFFILSVFTLFHKYKVSNKWQLMTKERQNILPAICEIHIYFFLVSCFNAENIPKVPITTSLSFCAIVVP